MNTARIVAFACLLPLPSLAQSKSEAALTPAQQKIAFAQVSIEREPDVYQSYNDLARALERRARETGDPQLFEQAAAPLVKSLELSPGNFEARKLQAAALLGQHRYEEALRLAGELNTKMMDDLEVYGLLCDANAALGDYAAAEKAAQWMVDMRPENVGGLTRAGDLRVIFGDPEGAVEVFNLAYALVPAGDVDVRAVLLARIAEAEIAAGKIETAQKLAEQALAVFPAHPAALRALAHVKTAQHMDAAAVEMLRALLDASPQPAIEFELALALESAGRADESAETFARFEAGARARIDAADNANRELVLYYLDHKVRHLALDPADAREALRIAELESAGRRDVETLHALAWAQRANGKLAEAKKTIEKALSVGTRDFQLAQHAAVIEREAGGEKTVSLPAPH